MTSEGVYIFIHYLHNTVYNIYNINIHISFMVGFIVFSLYINILWAGIL